LYPDNVNLFDYTPTRELARAGTIPARWYTDPQMLALEREKVFAATWQPVGYASWAAEPGDYFACDIAGEPVIVARGKDGELRAFSNVCRHRASIIAEGRGHAAVLKCPYHAWTYALDGQLVGAPEFDGVEDWDRSQVCLPRYRAETWGPFVFVNQDPLAPAVLDVLGQIPREVEQLGCAVTELRFAERRDYVINCNWKVYIDNYLEGYHLPAAHPGLFRMLDYGQYRVDTHRYYSSQYAPLKRSNSKALYYWIFPNFMLNIYSDNLSSNIIVPMGHDKTLTIFEWFSYGANPSVAPASIDFSEEIQQEDIKICEAVQRGLQSRTYNKGRFSAKRENGVHHFHLLLHEFLSKPAPQSC
jgi:phenylpropionate dioxygenase-like ring-hydroxylating dioxygenase large terminal subunit